MTDNSGVPYRFGLQQIYRRGIHDRLSCPWMLSSVLHVVLMKSPLIQNSLVTVNLSYLHLVLILWYYTSSCIRPCFALTNMSSIDQTETKFGVSCNLYLMVSVHSCRSSQHRSVSSPDLHARRRKANAKLRAACEPTLIKPEVICSCAVTGLQNTEICLVCNTYQNVSILHFRDE